MYSESAWSFMTPPDETNLSALKKRGAKLMVYHGTSDPVFSLNDTTDWYQRLTAANGGDASNFARLYTIAGMNHCSGGPSTDQFDMLTPMIAWVEQGKAPDSVVATARDASNVVPNTDVPADWGAGRTRPSVRIRKSPVIKAAILMPRAVSRVAKAQLAHCRAITDRAENASSSRMTGTLHARGISRLLHCRAPFVASI